MCTGKLLKYVLCLCLFPVGLGAQTGSTDLSEGGYIKKSTSELHWDAINRHRDGMERGGAMVYDYATCGNTFPPDIAEGRTVVVSGYIKTENLKDGWAGFWWHSDRRQNLYDIKDMRLNGPNGTTDWQHFSITMHTPRNPLAMDFGCIMAGKGKAWFDNLKIEIDGIDYTEYAKLMNIAPDKLPDLNLDFEKLDTSNKPLEWGLDRGDDYNIYIDSTVKYSGKYSLAIGPKPVIPKDKPAPFTDSVIKPKRDTILVMPHANIIKTDSVKLTVKQSGSTTYLYVESKVKTEVHVLSTDRKMLIQKYDAERIDISALPKGVYNVEVYDVTKRLMKTSKLLKE